MQHSLLVLVIIFTLAACSKNAGEQKVIPACLQSAIDSAMIKPKGYLSTEISAYTYQGITVYLFVPGCCDRYIDLKDANCNYLFSPSGGITGRGDGTHPNFYTEAKFIELIWKDPRP
jgi:hypothetical protein